MTLDVRDSLDHCVKCTICETACPYSNATPLFPGPKYVGPQAERYRTGEASPDHSLDLCSGCGICTQVCPHGVLIAEINSKARAQMWEERGIPLRNKLIARPSMTGRLGTPAAPLANWTLGNGAARQVLDRALRIDRRAPLPRFAGHRFESWARKHESPPAGRSIAYFHGCSANYYEPRVGQMVVRVLEHNGFQVVVPTQDCCGLPLQSNGDFPSARRYVRRLAANLAPQARAGIDIVTGSTSCGLMLKREAREILDVTDPDVRLVGEQTWDLCELLLDLHDRGELRTDFAPLPVTVPYHAPCQQRGHGIGKPALDLLALIPGLRLIELDADCCGIAGTYGLKKGRYEIAMKVGEPLFRDVREIGPDVVACDSETCRWQITHATGFPAAHPVELLYRAYGLSL